MCLGQERHDGKTESKLLIEFTHVKNDIYTYIYFFYVTQSS
jgi:hypothetical protein